MYASVAMQNLNTPKSKTESVSEREDVRRLRVRLQTDLGPTVCRLLEQEDVLEVCRNPNGTLFIKRRGAEWEEICLISDEHADLVVRTVATALKRPVTKENPFVQGLLPHYNCRFQAEYPPVTTSPSFAIRIPPRKLYTIDDYVSSAIMTSRQAELIRNAVDERHNIVVAGGTFSGKTTLTNAILDYMVKAWPYHRMILIEDTQELICKARNSVPMCTYEYATHQHLLRATLRNSPDRIIVGEVRGQEAYAMIKLWNTGHPGGACTIHANDANSAPLRLHAMLKEAVRSPNPADVIEAVQVLVVITKTPGLPKITDIATVNGYNQKTRQYRVCSLI